MASNASRQLTQELGKSGTLIFAGHIVAEEYNRRLSTLYGRLQAYDIMSRSDPDVHAVLELVKMPLLSAQWKMKPAVNPDGEVEDSDKAIADRLEYELFHNNIDFDDFLYQACDMLDFGFSVFEEVFGMHDYNGQTLWGIDKLAFRKQTTIYAWEMADGNPGITQMIPGEDNHYIPMEKLCVFTNKKRGDNYEGISLLRYVYRDWDMKDKLTLMNVMALEQLAKGVPVLRIDPAATSDPNETDLNNAEEALKNMRANDTGYLRLPKGVLVEMLDLKGATTKDVKPTLEMHKRAIYSSIIATFMDMGGSAGSGAKALSTDLTSLFLKSEEYFARTLASTINNQLIKRLCDLNYSDLPNGYPQLVCGNIGDDDITALSTAINVLMTAGALTPDPEMEDVIRTKIGMPNMPDDVKDTYAAEQEAKKAGMENAAKAGTTPEAEPDGDEPTTPAATTKKDAALHASREAYRKTIDVFFADEV